MIDAAPAQGCRIVRNAKVAMRDGVGLATTVILPAREGRYPVVLVRTAYNRVGMADASFAERGMAFVCQDCRGRYDSGGEWQPFLSEADDGYDTLQWIAAQPWCNGRIGMFGDSYLAATQFHAAQQGHELLCALNPRFMSGDCWKRGYYSDGAFALALTWSWLCFECSARTSEASMMPLWDVGKLLRSLPIVSMDERSGAEPMPHYRHYARSACYGEAWRPLNIHEDYGCFTMPVLMTGGWYDNYAAEAARIYNGLVRSAASEKLARSHRLLIGPWPHGINASSALGQLDFGPDALRENDSTQRWLECMLKGGDAADFQDAPVRIFVMGANRWRDESQWPPARTQYRALYLHGGGRANSLHGDGGLSFDAPGEQPADGYAYDPDHPVPTLGGNHSVGAYNPGLYEIARPGPFDQRPLERRDDVLVYTSEALEEDMEVTGPVVVKLYAASSCKDTDFVARLSDVYPDGRAINISEGVIRARFRESIWGKPKLLAPGRTYEFTIDLQVTSNLFRRGHRVRLDVTSSNFPLWDRNLNTGSDSATDTEMCVARQTVRHDAECPSHVMLPVAPG